MKTKTLLIVLLSCLFSVSAFSQWGIKAGVDYGTLAGYDITNYKIGFHAGATYDFKLKNNFYFQPAALFSLYSFGFDETIYMKEGKVQKYSLEIPANFSYRPRVSSTTSLVFDLGLYAKYGLFGDMKYITQEDETTERSSYDAYNRFDVGVGAGVGVDISKVYVGVGYQYGLTNGEGGIQSVHNQIFRASLGYKF